MRSSDIDPQLRDLRERAEKGGVEAVVEVFDEKDLALARESGARIIQVDRAASAFLQASCPEFAFRALELRAGISAPPHSAAIRRL